MPRDRLYPHPGFIVYKNRVEENPHTFEPELTRDIVTEVHDENQAKEIVARERAADPDAGENWIYYEPGTIYD
jgi:hypothetical protein